MGVLPDDSLQLLRVAGSCLKEVARLRSDVKEAFKMLGVPFRVFDTESESDQLQSACLIQDSILREKLVGAILQGHLGLSLWELASSWRSASRGQDDVTTLSEAEVRRLEALLLAELSQGSLRVLDTMSPMEQQDPESLHTSLGSHLRATVSGDFNRGSRLVLFPMFDRPTPPLVSAIVRCCARERLQPPVDLLVMALRVLTGNSAAVSDLEEAELLAVVHGTLLQPELGACLKNTASGRVYVALSLEAERQLPLPVHCAHGDCSQLGHEGAAAESSAARYLMLPHIHFIRALCGGGDGGREQLGVPVPGVLLGLLGVLRRLPLVACAAWRLPQALCHDTCGGALLWAYEDLCAVDPFPAQPGDSCAQLPCEVPSGAVEETWPGDAWPTPCEVAATANYGTDAGCCDDWLAPCEATGESAKDAEPRAACEVDALWKVDADSPHDVERSVPEQSLHPLCEVTMAPVATESASQPASTFFSGGSSGKEHPTSSSEVVVGGIGSWPGQHQDGMSLGTALGAVDVADDSASACSPDSMKELEEAHCSKEELKVRFVQCFRNDLQQDRQLLMSQVNNLYKMRNRGRPLSYKQCRYETLHDFLLDIPGLQLQGVRNKMQVKVIDMEAFEAFYNQITEGCTLPLFEAPRPMPETFCLRVIEVFTRAGGDEVTLQRFRDVWNSVYPSLKLQCRDFGYRDLRGLLANLDFVEKVGSKAKAAYALKPEAVAEYKKNIEAKYGGLAWPVTEEPVPWGRAKTSGGSQTSEGSSTVLTLSGLVPFRSGPPEQAPVYHSEGFVLSSQGRQAPPGYHSEGFNPASGHQVAAYHSEGFDPSAGYGYAASCQVAYPGHGQDWRAVTQPQPQWGRAARRQSEDRASRANTRGCGSVPLRNFVRGQTFQTGPTIGPGWSSEQQLAVTATTTAGSYFSERLPLPGDSSPAFISEGNANNMFVYSSEGSYSQNAHPDQRDMPCAQGGHCAGLGGGRAPGPRTQAPMGPLGGGAAPFSPEESPWTTPGNADFQPQWYSPALPTEPPKAEAVPGPQSRPEPPQHHATGYCSGGDVGQGGGPSRGGAPLAPVCVERPSPQEPPPQPRVEKPPPLREDHTTSHPPAARSIGDMQRRFQSERPPSPTSAGAEEDEPGKGGEGGKVAASFVSEAPELPSWRRRPKTSRTISAFNSCPPAAISTADRDASRQQGRFDRSFVYQAKLRTDQNRLIVDFSSGRVLMANTSSQALFEPLGPLFQRELADLIHEEDRENLSAKTMYFNIGNYSTMEPQALRILTAEGFRNAALSGERLEANTWCLDFIVAD